MRGVFSSSDESSLSSESSSESSGGDEDTTLNAEVESIIGSYRLRDDPRIQLQPEKGVDQGPDEIEKARHPAPALGDILNLLKPLQQQRQLEQPRGPEQQQGAFDRGAAPWKPLVLKSRLKASQHDASSTKPVADQSQLEQQQEQPQLRHSHHQPRPLGTGVFQTLKAR